MRVKLGDLVRAAQTNSISDLISEAALDEGGKPVLGPNGQPIRKPLKIDIVMAYTLKTIVVAVNKELETFNEQATELRQRFPDKPEQAQIDELNTETQKLLDAEVILPGIGRIKLSKLHAAGVQASEFAMEVLDWLIKPDLQLFEKEDEEPAGESAAKPS